MKLWLRKMTALKLSGCSGRGEPVSAILQLLRDMSQLWQELGGRGGQWTGQRQSCAAPAKGFIYVRVWTCFVAF